MSDHLLNDNQEVDETFRTLMNNTNAAKAVSRVVEGTIGPKGLDVMLIDSFGGIAVSNDGLTILNLMEVNHPVARMIISAVQAQQSEVGDGTTTTAILAGAMIAEGSERILKGVPVSWLVDGINAGIREAIRLTNETRVPISSVDSELLFNTALIAGRGYEDIARLVMAGASLIGVENLLNPDYKFADAVISREKAEDEVFNGIIINKEPINETIYTDCICNPVIMVIDDALGPGKIESDALKTDRGFQHYMQSRDTYAYNLEKIRDIGVNLLVVYRGIDDIAEEFLNRSGIAAVQKVSSHEIENLCRHTGAKKIKRSTLDESMETLKLYTGNAQEVYFAKKYSHICIKGGGECCITILTGASTREVADERERIARDAAAAVQAAVQGGVVAGGGALEVWLAEQLQCLAEQEENIRIHGINCVREALQRPFLCMASNAGLSPLKKLGQIISAQKEAGGASITIDYDSEYLIDAFENGIVDPAIVKINALKTAGEVAAAVLRINTIIRMKTELDDMDSSYLN